MTCLTGTSTRPAKHSATCLCNGCMYAARLGVRAWIRANIPNVRIRKECDLGHTHVEKRKADYCIFQDRRADCRRYKLLLTGGPKDLGWQLRELKKLARDAKQYFPKAAVETIKTRGNFRVGYHALVIRVPFGSNL